MIVYLTIVLFILFLLLQEKNQKKQAKGMLCQLLPQLKPLPLETLGPHRHSLCSTLTPILFKQKMFRFSA